MRRILSYILLICVCWSAAGQGLRFSGLEESSMDLRTSLRVFDSRPPVFTGDFTISFDCRIYDEARSGYLLRVRNYGEDEVINLFFDDYSSDAARLRLNIEGSRSLVSVKIPKDTADFSSWNRISIEYNLAADSLALYCSGIRLGSASLQLEDWFRPDIYFGRSDHIINTPSFAIKNISIGNQFRSVEIPLDESDGLVIHDNKGRRTGSVSSPNWLINNAYSWKQVASFSSSSRAAAGFDPSDRTVRYFNRDTLYSYSFDYGLSGPQVFPVRCPVDIFVGRTFSDDGYIYAYEAYKRDGDSCTVARFPASGLQWEPVSDSSIEMQVHHHGSVLIGRDLYLTGGFGDMRYNGTLYRLNLDDGLWAAVPLEGDRIIPRYFSSTGYCPADSCIYIYGGMGNEEGDHMVGRQYLYDLHKIDLRTMTSKKLWTIDWDGEDCVAVRGMVFDGNGSFYTFCYPESISHSALQLYRFSLADGSHEEVGGTIPIISDKIMTNANLYFDEAAGQLVATVEETLDDVHSTLKVYTLVFPPVSAATIKAHQYRSGIPLWLVPCCAFLAALVAVAMILIRRRRRREAESAPSEEKAVGRLLRDHQDPYEGKADTIRLFGPFSARNKAGKDISYMFPESMRNLLCLLFRYYDDGGISTRKMSSLLWPDKEDDKVKNSRGVALNHLRKALSDIEGISVVFDSGRFRIETTEPFHCDFLDMLEYISTGEIDKIVDIACRGRFLSFTSNPMFDSFKNATDDKVIPVLQREMEKRYSVSDWAGAVYVSDALLRQDPLDENALAICIKSLVAMGLDDEAALRYQAFANVYRKAYDTDFPTSLRQLAHSHGRSILRNIGR